MAKKQSVLKLAREKKKESAREDKVRQKTYTDSQNNRFELKNILKKAGHNTKQIDAIINGMNDKEINGAVENYKANN